MAAFLEELAAIMRKMDVPIAETITTELFNKINAMPYDMKSSMQRDLEKSLPLEADHLQGYLLQHAQDIAVPLLETIYTKLEIYEKNR